MGNLSFLKEILMSNADYWIVARQQIAREYGRDVRKDDDIIFISIPCDIKRGLKYEEITLQEIEKLHSSYVDQNIFLSNDYPPFQRYISFHDIYKGYPIEKNIKDFLMKAIVLKSNDLYKYKELID